jgi:hypothetical protein
MRIGSRWTDSLLAHDGVLTDVVADCSLPSGSVSVTWNWRVWRSHVHVSLLAGEAAPSCVGRTPSGIAAGVPATSSASDTEGASAPWTVSSMQPTVEVEAVSVNGPGSPAGAGFGEEHGAFGWWPPPPDAEESPDANELRDTEELLDADAPAVTVAPIVSETASSVVAAAQRASGGRVRSMGRRLRFTMVSSWSGRSIGEVSAQIV